jgi:hypothetical protein
LFFSGRAKESLSILDGVVLYRLLTVVDDRADQVVAITTLVVVMLDNEVAPQRA